jgi:hypothetical protein
VCVCVKISDKCGRQNVRKTNRIKTCEIIVCFLRDKRSKVKKNRLIKNGP